GNVWLGNPIQIRLHEVAHVDLIIHQMKNNSKLCMQNSCIVSIQHELISFMDFEQPKGML
ncbi:MAG: hypothetical protein RR224_11540, partial [Clostridia bacterium]